MNNIDEVTFKEAVREYRRIHECKYCPYYERPRRCEGELHCLIEQELRKEENRSKKQNKKPCPHDEEGGCPYANESGTCFGFCLQKILKEMHHDYREEQRHEQIRSNRN